MRLSSPLQEISSRYTVVVVGSGYGGGITASRLARAGQSVCVLERGAERQPGEYPDTTAELIAQTQVAGPRGRFGSRLGLFDFVVGDDMNVLVGCGLGGTSLINANVSVRAEPRVFDDPRWPLELRRDKKGMADGYGRAEEMLRPTPYPTNLPVLPKLEAQKHVARALGAEFAPAPLNVTFQALPGDVNHVGVEQHPCKLCGDCATGCNHRAKNTTLMNYLPDAWNHGAKIFTAVSVRSISRTTSGWAVHYVPVSSGREAFDDQDELTVGADVVVLAAGALGSTEILLRSKARGLALSDKVGHGFTGNGDVLAFAYNNDRTIDGIGAGHIPPGKTDAPRPGPTITGIVDLRNRPNLDDGMIIEEGAVPGALAHPLPGVLAAAAKVSGVDTDSGFFDAIAEGTRRVESAWAGPYHGAVENTQTYLVMSHDDGAGRIRLDNDRARIDWPGVGKQPVFQRVAARLTEATKALGGTFVANPLWLRGATHPLVTVHPLGGCVMADDAGNGVVNHKGQVFSGASGGTVYDGLYVNDGAVIPRSVGVNPLLTIAAVGERCAALLAADRNWTPTYDLPSRPPAPPRQLPVGVEFTERMAGHLSTVVLDDYARADADGTARGSGFSFTLTIAIDDLARFMADETADAGMIGTVDAPALSPEPLTVTEGKFNLFVTDPARPGGKQMRYRMKLTAVDGTTFFLEGHKLLHDDLGMDMWPDATTLYVTVYPGDAPGPTIAGKGILRISKKDFLRQLTTTKAINAAGTAQAIETVATFGKYFAGTLLKIYG